MGVYRTNLCLKMYENELSLIDDADTSNNNVFTALICINKKSKVYIGMSTREAEVKNELPVEWLVSNTVAIFWSQTKDYETDHGVQKY